MEAGGNRKGSRKKRRRRRRKENGRQRKKEAKGRKKKAKGKKKEVCPERRRELRWQRQQKLVKECWIRTDARKDVLKNQGICLYQQRWIEGRTVTYLLFKLGIKTPLHLVEISIF